MRKALVIFLVFWTSLISYQLYSRVDGEVIGNVVDRALERLKNIHTCVIDNVKDESNEELLISSCQEETLEKENS